MKKLLLLFLTSLSFAQLQRVEPPFWWENMHRESLQILFYGKNIASHEVTVSDQIPILNCTKTENPNYLFVTIPTKNLKKGNLTFTFSQNKKKFTHTYEIKDRKENSRFRKSFDSSDLVYLIMPDRFANGDTSNDSHQSVIEKPNRNNINGRYGGDIKGIIQNLDYIKDLGVTALWSTPLCEDNDERGSYHHYGQSDVYKIDPRFGTNETYLELSKQLHLRGMKLIKDYVTNHWSYNHWMMHDMPSYDWFHQFPGYKQTNYKTTTQMDPNVAASDKKLAMDGWFVKSMPDLNQKNPLVMNYLIQNAIWWIEFADLDGYRVDTYPYADKESMATWTKAITDEYPNFNITAEAWLYTHAQIAYWQKDSKIGAIQNYNSYCPNVMDFMLFGLFEKGFLKKEEQTWAEGMIQLYDHFSNDFLFSDTNNLLVFAENHDTQRINFVYPNLKDYQLAMTILATVRGIPQIYYGSEIGMTGSKDKGDGDIRREFPGGWPDHAQNAFDQNTRTAEQEAYHSFTKKVFQWRKNAKAIHHGKTTHYLPQNNVYVYFRHTEQESVMVVINNSNQKQEISLDRFEENLKEFSEGTDILTNQSFEIINNKAVTSTITIEPKSSKIIELKK